MEKIYFTREGFENLNARRESHEEKKRQLYDELGKACKDDPDLPENLISKEIRVKFHTEIPEESKKIREYLDAAVSAEDEFDDVPEDVIWIGSRVVYSVEGEDDEVQTLTILGALESDPENDIISYQAPIAEAMLGKKAGDIFQFNDKLKFKIVSVARILEK